MQQVNCITLALNKRDESESVCAYCSRVLLNWSCIHILTMGYEGFLCNLIISEFVVAELILLLVLLEPVAIHFIKWWKMCHDINIWNASPNNKIAHWKLAYVKWRTVLKAGILFISTFIRSVGVAMVTYCIVLALYTVSYNAHINMGFAFDAVNCWQLYEFYLLCSNICRRPLSTPFSTEFNSLHKSTGNDVRILRTHHEVCLSYRQLWVRHLQHIQHI